MYTMRREERKKQNHSKTYVPSPNRTQPSTPVDQIYKYVVHAQRAAFLRATVVVQDLAAGGSAGNGLDLGNNLGGGGVSVKGNEVGSNTGNVGRSHRGTGKSGGGTVGSDVRGEDGASGGPDVDEAAVVAVRGLGISGAGDGTDGDSIRSGGGGVSRGIGSAVSGGDGEGHTGSDTRVDGAVERSRVGTTERHVGNGC